MLNEFVLVIFYFAILVYSIIIHEIAHGFVALWLGDITAKYLGRLTFNPLPHIDPIGSILIPLLLIPTGFAFGYAKPVPYNPANLSDRQWGSLKVALAGPASNFLVVFAATALAWLIPLATGDKFEILSRLLGVVTGDGGFVERFQLLTEVMVGSLPSIFFGLLLMVILWNVIIGCFNILPLPLLDGSKIAYALFSVREETQQAIERYGIFILIALILFEPTSRIIGQFIWFFLSFFFGLAT
jgi:Zn-dependent protease